MIEGRLTTGGDIAELFRGIGIEPEPRPANEIVALADCPEVAIAAARLAAAVDFTDRPESEWIVAALDLAAEARDLNGEPPSPDLRHSARCLGAAANLAAVLIRDGVLRPLPPVERCTLSDAEIMRRLVTA
jgi:hypothetical protein